jgi:two-component system chemotaxis response regulator CheY
MRNTTTVLIVEDDADIREVMKIFLEANGYCVNVAADGLEALEQLRAGLRPELILLDLMMPRLDGEQFLKQFRVSRFGDIPVVIMSGHSAAEKKALEFKAAACLLKPVEGEQLLTTVRLLALSTSKNDVA